MNNANLYHLIASRLPTDPSRPLIMAPDRVYNWADLEKESSYFATVLTALGCVKGDRVAVQVDKSPAALFLYLACLRAGFVFLPINTAYRTDEVDYLIGDAEPAVVVVSPAVAAATEAVATRHGNRHTFTLAADGSGSLPVTVPAVPFTPVCCTPDDVAALLYTSGTTGRPKGAMLSHHNLAVNGEALRTSWAFTTEDILLHTLPIFHAHGLFVACHCVLLSGARMIWLPAFDRTQVLAYLPQATVFMGIPTYYTRLLACNDLTAATCTHMRLFTSGSAPLLPETFRAFQHRTGRTILERYGMTETGINTSNPYEGELQPGRVGRPLPGVSVRVAGVNGALLSQGQVGVLQVRGDNVFLGYWRQLDRTADFTSDGWFITGDLAQIENDGTITLVGRARDLIISGGYNVYPREVEQVIDALDGVIESAVIGLPHPDFGEAVVAVVQMKPNHCLAAEIILRHVHAHLANYKVPKVVVFVDELPRNAMGKVQKTLLRQTHATALTVVE